MLVNSFTPGAYGCNVNTLRPRQNGRRFADDTFKRIFLNDNVRISIKISPTFVPKGPINNIPALVQIMACRLTGAKPLSETMMVKLPTHICVTRPQWVKCVISKQHHQAVTGLVLTKLYAAVGASQLNLVHNLMACCKTAVTPLLTHMSYCSLSLNHQYNNLSPVWLPTQ